ncbi:hypothetical protein ACFYZ3_38410 [Streptomyces sp. NPDC001599]|uniref:hypothetical protein n=1 Tax=Streptomyces sp. NPDC001599 TaxID=3364591 RepID=UPI00368E3510
MSSDAARIAQMAKEFKIAFSGFSLAIVPLADPRLPLVGIFQSLYEQSADSPLIIRRQDGTEHSSQRIFDVFANAAKIPGAGLRGDLLAFMVMHGVARIGDAIDQARLRDPSSPLLEFTRHLRNACAHGNRWHFRGTEPRFPAALRARSIDSSLHGSQAVNGWLGPGDYLDLLDDLADHFGATDQAATV